MTFEEQFEQLQKMFDSSDCDIEVLPPDEEKAKKLRAQGGEFTPLAAILAGTGGVSVNGILRFLGSGMMDFFERNERLFRDGHDDRSPKTFSEVSTVWTSRERCFTSHRTS